MPSPSFVRESDMVAALMPRIRRLAGWRSGDVDVFFEVPAIRGIPDIVMVQFETGAAVRPPVADRSALATWLALTDRYEQGLPPASSRDLALFAGVTSGYLGRTVLPGLTDAGVVKGVGRGRWSVLRPYDSPVSRLVTVELKIRDRFGALRQAASHGQGTDRAWVVLDAARLPTDKNTIKTVSEAYASRGIGLATLHNGGSVSVLTRPARGGAPCFSSFSWRVARAVLAERILSMHQAGVNIGPAWPVFGRDLSVEQSLQGSVMMS